MSRVLRLRRGSTAETAAFTGKLAEVTVDTSTWSLIVHDNATVGGHRIATEAYVESNKAVTSTGNTAPSNNVTEGSMWFDSVSGRLYVNYNGAWIDANPAVENNVIGNLQIDDTTISSTNVNANINIDPDGFGIVAINGTLYVKDDEGIKVGSGDQLTIRRRAAGVNGNPYNRMVITTAPSFNANIALSLSATTNEFMFFNPETGNIGVNTRNPNKTLQVAGNIGATGYTANVGLNAGFNFNIGNSYATGLFHLTEFDTSKLQLQHNGNVGLVLFDTGDMFLPGRKLQINQSPYFTPQNSRLIYADDETTFVQFAMQNRNSGSSASTDVALFADNGDDSVNYVDMGITSSTYNDPAYSLYGPNDAYLLSASGNGSKLILNTYNDSDIVFATGGTLAENEIARFQNGEGLVMHGNVIPASNVAYNLGAPGNEWNSLYVSNNTIYLGGIPLSIDNTNNLTVDGNPVGSGALAPSSNAPGSASEGQLWFDVEDGHLYVRYSNVWVDTTIAGSGGGTLWTNPANGCLRAELSGTGFQAYTTASHLDLQDGGIWNIGSYQNSTSIGNDQFSNQHDLSLRSGDATFITTNLRENGNHQWKFGTDAKLTLPDFGAITSPNYGFSFNKDSGKTGAPELGTDVTFATESLDSDIVDSEVYMGSGYGEFRSIYNKVDSTESGLAYAGVEGFNYAQHGDVNFAGMVSQTPNIDSMYALSLNEQGQIVIGFTQNGQTQQSNDWSVAVGTLTTDYTVNGLFANTTTTVIGTGLSSWKFDNAGVLNLPNNNGQIGQLEAPYTGLEFRTGSGADWIGISYGEINDNNTSYFYFDKDGSDYTTADHRAHLQIKNPAHDGHVEWLFESDGKLTAPGNLVIAGNASLMGGNGALIQSADNLPLLALTSGTDGGIVSFWAEDVGDLLNSNIAAVYANPTSGSGIVRIAVGQNGSPGPNLWDFGTDGVLNLPEDIGDIKRNGASVLPASNLPKVEITATSTPGYYIGQGNITISVSSTTTPTAVGVLMMSAIDGGYIPANIWAGTNTTGSQTIHYTGWGSGSHYIAQAYATNTAGTAYSAPVVGQSDYCFAKGTLITLADGTTKPVEQITYADRIMTWDLDNAQFTHSRPMWIKKAETADWYSRYTFSDGTELKLVATHRIFNKQAGKFTSPVNAILQKYLTGKNLPVKDETPVGTVSFNSAGEEVTLVHKEHVWETVEHYSLIVDYHMNTFANGIMTGHAQSSIYPIVDMKFVKDNRVIKDITEFEGIPERFVKGMRLQEQDFDMDYVRSVIDILLSKEIAFSQAEAA